MLDSIPNIYALGLAVIFLAAVYAYRDLRWRRFYQKAEHHQLKPSWLWGHLDVLGKKSMEGPPARHVDYVFGEIREELGSPPMFMVDMRPLAWCLTVIADHSLAEQVTRASKLFPWSVPKSPTILEVVSLLGEQSMLVKEGEEWKTLRRRFNPGFAPKHLLSLLPAILDKTQYYLDALDRLAESGEEVAFNELTTNLTFDIIGAVVLDTDLNAQSGKSELVDVFQAMARTFMNPSPPGFARFFLRQRYIRSQYKARMNSILSAHVRGCYEKQKKHASEGKARSRSVLSLSLEGLDTLDDTMNSMICDQLKSFLFAGHDTTSIALQWAIYELWRTPRALAAVRAELDAIFGPDIDPSSVRDQLLGPNSDELYSRLHYTSAVMKETLRLYPPAGGARYIPKGSNFRFTMPDGSLSPIMDDQVIYLCHRMIQRDPSVYGETAEIFEPERWLGNSDTSMAAGVDLTEAAAAGDKQHAIPASAWRPFERGQRNCIGQELANIEMRVILACTVRKFDFEKVGLGELLKDEKGQNVMGACGQYQTASTLYNTVKVTAQPVDGMRLKVKLTEKARAGGRT